jgi:hypothetical protein
LPRNRPEQGSDRPGYGFHHISLSAEHPAGDFRPREWREDMVVNHVLMTWVTTVTDRQSPKTTLEAVAAQTASMKKTGTTVTLVEVLALSPRLPLWVRQSLFPLLRLTGSRLIDTAQLSNLGQVDAAPSFLRLRDAEFSVAQYTYTPDRASRSLSCASGSSLGTSSPDRRCAARRSIRRYACGSADMIARRRQFKIDNTGEGNDLAGGHWRRAIR